MQKTDTSQKTGNLPVPRRTDALMVSETPQMLDHKRELIRLASLGLPANAIARRLGMSPALCRRVLESPDVRGAVEEARINDTINMLECDRLVSTDTLKAAVSLLSDIISGDIEATTGQRIKAAQILMDREPTRRYTKTSRVENYSTRMEVDLDAVLDRVIGEHPHLREAARGADDFTDGEDTPAESAWDL